MWQILVYLTVNFCVIVGGDDDDAKVDRLDLG